MEEASSTFSLEVPDLPTSPCVDAILDCGYGWPYQKRPRRERIGAVAKQIFNFVHSAVRLKQEAGDMTTATGRAQLQLLVIGADLAELQERLCSLGVAIACAENGMDGRVPLRKDAMQIPGALECVITLQVCEMAHVLPTAVDSKVCASNAAGPDPAAAPEGCGDTASDVDGDVAVAEAAENAGMMAEEGAESATAPAAAGRGGTAATAGPSTATIYVYLSPDATQELSSEMLFPPNTVFIVGGIIDRVVKRGRSVDRAAACRVQSARLPLAAAQASFSDDEPLNVDTVLEALLFWKAGVKGKTLDLGRALRYALDIHAERHPKMVSSIEAK
jgi:hypothetical protein